MLKNLIPKSIRQALKKSFFIQTYQYRLDITNSRSYYDKLTELIQAGRRCVINRKKIAFFPEGPREFHAIYKLLKFLGYQISVGEEINGDLSIKWWLAFDGNPFAPDNVRLPRFSQKGNNHRTLNPNCDDISKNRVNTIFEEIFGYSLAVDPRRHAGKCVMKLNWNALHQGKVIDCPTDPDDEDVVFQKLVNNEVENGLVEDMRVPVFGTIIPFVYLKYRSVEDRLVDRNHTNKKAKIAEVRDVLSEKEQKNIFRFCKQMGLDYCEVDVLRDKDEGRIYIVDANNTPSGPPSPISIDDGKTAVIRLAEAFEKAYGA